jgi:L-amino acid N-acyltransferase YncA
MPIRDAVRADLPAIVDIYNAAIPGRMATADLTPVTVAEREGWFAEFDPIRRPLWVACDAVSGTPLAWLSLRSFYGRPAYDATVEVSVYTAPESQRAGHARQLLQHALASAPALAIRTLLAFTFAHNAPSIRLFQSRAFIEWGRLPGVANMAGVKRDLLILGRPL